jgi:hypothetical protein
MKDLKIIHVCDFFYIIDFDIARPFPKTNRVTSTFYWQLTTIQSGVRHE